MQFCSPAITEFNNVHQPEKSIISAAHHLKHPHETKGLWNCFIAKGHLSLKSREEGKKTQYCSVDNTKCVFWKHTDERVSSQRKTCQNFPDWNKNLRFFASKLNLSASGISKRYQNPTEQHRSGAIFTQFSNKILRQKQKAEGRRAGGGLIKWDAG